MLNTNLLAFVLSRLDSREPPWTEVARQSGVPYDTLKKIARRTTPNPGVKHVQALADFFSAHPVATTSAHGGLNAPSESGVDLTESGAHGPTVGAEAEAVHHCGGGQR